jgi:hypothetical protein
VTRDYHLAVLRFQAMEENYRITGSKNLPIEKLFTLTNISLK